MSGIHGPQQRKEGYNYSYFICPYCKVRVSGYITRYNRTGEVVHDNSILEEIIAQSIAAIR